MCNTFNFNDKITSDFDLGFVFTYYPFSFLNTLYENAFNLILRLTPIICLTF